MRDDTLRSCEVSSPAQWRSWPAGCAGPGFFTDGSSVSVGSFNHGALRRGARLPAQGEGYVIPALWQKRAAPTTPPTSSSPPSSTWRGACGASIRAPSSASATCRCKGGGDSVLHRSHENGRDLDLIYYAVDERSRPVAPADSMPRYPFFDLRAREPGPQEHGVVFGPFSTRFFDVKRNWALVRALLEEPGIEIQYLFIHARLRERLLAYAAEQGEDPSLLERAEAILHQPGDSAPHDDHLHVRIFCAEDDRALRLQGLGAGALVEEALQVHGADGAARRRRRARRRAGAAHRHRSLS